MNDCGMKDPAIATPPVARREGSASGGEWERDAR